MENTILGSSKDLKSMKSIFFQQNGMQEGQGGDMAEVKLFSISHMTSEAHEKQNINWSGTDFSSDVIRNPLAWKCPSSYKSFYIRCKNYVTDISVICRWIIFSQESRTYILNLWK